jgi:hypothetical protein
MCCLFAHINMLLCYVTASKLTQDDGFPLEGLEGQHMGEKHKMLSYKIRSLLMCSVLEKPSGPAYPEGQGSMVDADTRTAESDQNQTFRGIHCS